MNYEKTKQIRAQALLLSKPEQQELWMAHWVETGEFPDFARPPDDAYRMNGIAQALVAARKPGHVHR